jgi:hypothetical protein
MGKRRRSKHRTGRAARPSRNRKRMLVVPVDGGWAVREGEHVTGPYETQRDAVNEALLLAGEHNVEVLVHDENGHFVRRAVHTVADQMLFKLWNNIYYHPERYSF